MQPTFLFYAPQKSFTWRKELILSLPSEEIPKVQKNSRGKPLRCISADRKSECFYRVLRISFCTIRPIRYNVRMILRTRQIGLVDVNVWGPRRKCPTNSVLFTKRIELGLPVKTIFFVSLIIVISIIYLLTSGVCVRVRALYYQKKKRKPFNNMATVEGEAAAAEFQDWEVLVNSDSELVNSPNSVDRARNFEEIDADSEGVIRLDYFSLDNDNRYAKSSVAVVDASEEDSVASDNPSWIDPGSDSRYQRRISGEFWSDSGSDRPDEGKIEDIDVKNELGVADYGKIQEGSEGIGGIKGNYAGEGKFEGKSEVGFEDSVKRHMIFEGLGESQGKDNDLAKFWSDSGRDGLIFGDAGKVDGGSKISGELGNENASEEGNLSIVAPEEQGPRGEEEKGKVVWWKVPFEVLKFCVFRVSPVWSFSMAAALMGFIILGRRLYKMKHKTQSLKLKVAMDDKKVSQVMSRTARVNEAFSVVRRVPIVRPLLPVAGLNPWPVLSLR